MPPPSFLSFDDANSRSLVLVSALRHDIVHIVKMLKVLILHHLQLVRISGKLVNASFVPRAFHTHAKRLATSLVAEIDHILFTHTTKLSFCKRFTKCTNFWLILPANIADWDIVCVHYVAIQLLAAMEFNPVLHPYHSLLFSFCTFCLVSIMVVYRSSCLRFFGGTGEVLERSLLAVLHCCLACLGVT